MSGSGGDGPPVSPASPTPCEQLKFRTTLQSPVEEVISTLRPKDVLDLDLRQVQGAPVIIAVGARGDAGSITSRMPELIRCIQSGNDFSANVVSIDDGMVVVHVQPK